jgi:hypothetical protein
MFLGRLHHEFSDDDLPHGFLASKRQAQTAHNEKGFPFFLSLFA